MRAGHVDASLDVARRLKHHRVPPERDLLNPHIAAHLTAGDDPELWDVATRALLAEAEASAVGTPQDVYAQK
jgi:hypothetical protein